jgi:hypothetical protein
MSADLEQGHGTLFSSTLQIKLLKLPPNDASPL